MNDNRYAPPKATVEGTAGKRIEAPVLWSPNAAAAWSLVLTPIFGCWLHMRNWQELEEPRRAAAARIWLVASVLIVAVTSLATIRWKLVVGMGFVKLAFLIAWYETTAKRQARYVSERYGPDFPHRGWFAPLLIAGGAILCYLASAALFLPAGGA